MLKIMKYWCAIIQHCIFTSYLTIYLNYNIYKEVRGVLK